MRKWGILVAVIAALTLAPVVDVFAQTISGPTPPTTQRAQQITIYKPGVNPAQTAAAVATVEQSFTLPGLRTTDQVFVTGPTPTSLCPLVGSRISASNTLILQFTVLTAVACTPATGTYTVTTIRR